MKKILVFAPHADDEILGCGGYLIHESKKGSNIRICIATIGGENKLQNFECRKEEFAGVCKMLGAEGKVLVYGKDSELNTVSKNWLVCQLDKEIEEFKPDEVFVNFASHHQDHQMLYDCAMASFRLKDGFMPKFVALYEYPFINNGELKQIYGGRCLHDISDVIGEKVALFNLYKSQIKKSPSPLNEHGIKALSQIRGIEIGVEHAELFYIQKEIL